MDAVVLNTECMYRMQDYSLLMHTFLCHSDPAMKQFLLHLDDTNALGKKFVIQDLDETHLFISSDIIQTLQDRIDGLMDKLHFPMGAQ